MVADYADPSDTHLHPAVRRPDAREANPPTRESDGLHARGPVAQRQTLVASNFGASMSMECLAWAQDKLPRIPTADAALVLLALADNCGQGDDPAAGMVNRESLEASLPAVVDVASALDLLVQERYISLDGDFLWMRMPRTHVPRSGSKTSGDSQLRRTRKQLIARDGGLCQGCGLPPEDLLPGEVFHVDHVVPVARGGGEELENKQLLCPTCNSSKGTLPMDKWVHRRGGGIS